MTSFPSDDRLITLFRSQQVCSLDQLRSVFSGSDRTLFRVLHRLGCLSSYNLNGSRYTLPDIPLFDAHGLWCFCSARFCRDHSLYAALLHLLGESPAGLSVAFLDNLLGVRVNDHLRSLLRQGKLLRRKVGRYFLYFPLSAGLHSSVTAPLFACLQVLTLTPWSVF
jgi:hypothetical protein